MSKKCFNEKISRGEMSYFSSSYDVGCETNKRWSRARTKTIKKTQNPDAARTTVGRIPKTPSIPTSVAPLNASVIPVWFHLKDHPVVRHLSQRIRQIEESVKLQSKNAGLLAKYESLLPDLKNITEEMFSGTVSIEVDFDPVDSDEKYFLFNVHIESDGEGLVKRQSQWHNEVSKIAPDSGNLFRISLILSE